jgi:hypothetical protein
MFKIQLNQSKFAIVDAEDYDWLNQWKWSYSRYAIRTTKEDRRTISMHRFIMDAPEGMEVDHINGDKLDNRRCNLRICTHQQNTCSRHRSTKKSSKYQGVSWNKEHKKWVAQIGINGKRINLGRFLLEEDAARAFDKAAKELHGEFARLNQIG